MKDFKIAQPRTVEELAALLAETTENVAIIAGGTDLLDELKSGVAAPDLLVDLAGVAGLAGITPEKDGLRIGPMTRIVDVARSADVIRDYGILSQAALSLATPQLRNVGTVGGNLCQRPRCWYYRDPQVVCRKKGGSRCYAFQGRNKYHAILGGRGCYIVYPSDMAPALISLGAKVVIGGAKGDTVLPLEEFYKTPAVDVRRENVLERGQFVKDIKVPAPKPGQKGAYVKLEERGTWDFALASAAVSGVLRDGAFTEITIVMGGIGTIPWRTKKAEAVLAGKPVTKALVDQAADAALGEASPLAENGYKKALAVAALRRAVKTLL
jgi:xanthine dehydrogenase YagS FAD-binding subunit